MNIVNVLDERGNAVDLFQATPAHTLLPSRTRLANDHCIGTSGDCGGHGAGDGQTVEKKYIYLVWPQRGTWLHRTTARRAGCAVVHAKYPLRVAGNTATLVH
jgi:hypothetical protein